MNTIPCEVCHGARLKDIVLAVKKNSYEYYTAKLGTDVNALKQVIEGKKALEELSRIRIAPN